MFIFLYIVCFVIGYGIAWFCSGRKVGEVGRVSWIFPIFQKYVLHLHHWLVAVVVAMMVHFAGIGNGYLFSFLSGVIINGLSYGDFYKIIYATEEDKTS